MSTLNAILTKLWFIFIASPRQRACWGLRHGTLASMSPPRNEFMPTVDASTRFKLESLRDINCSGSGVVGGVCRTLRELIKEETSSIQFDMTKLHGCLASKSFGDGFHLRGEINSERARQETMVDFGALVNDLKWMETTDRLEVDPIEACKKHHELRLSQGITIITDRWHNRYYWVNSGGSHHMARLCYELRKRNILWTPTVTLKEFRIDFAALNAINGVASLFVIMDRDGLCKDLLAGIPSYQRIDAAEELGITILPRIDGSCYRLVAVDHSKPWSASCLKVMCRLVSENYAAYFEDFLLRLNNT